MVAHLDYDGIVEVEGGDGVLGFEVVADGPGVHAYGRVSVGLGMR